MRNAQQYSESDPRHHTANLKKMLTDVINHSREDVKKITDPKAQALFETTAEVLTGLRKAFEDFEQKTEEAWKKAS
jgi:HD-like signal output (HDOD) protein